MSRMASRVGAMVALGVFAVSAAVAAPGDKKASSAPTCSVCHMPLSAKKDKAHPTAVTIKGKTYYCCAKCPMGKKGASKGKM